MIQPAGLTPTRQWYLYNEIRQYCTDSTKDLVCPLSTVPHTRNEDHDDDEEEEDDNDDKDEDNEEEKRRITSHLNIDVECVDNMDIMHAHAP